MSLEDAALIEDETLSEQTVEESTTDEVVESAATDGETVPAEEPKEDGFQKRINKVTADKYAEKRRADELQQKLDAMQAKPKEVSEAPKLEDFDHDEDAFSAASIKHQVAEAVRAERVAIDTQSQQATVAETQRVFNERIVAMDKADFDEVSMGIPQLPVGVAEALVQSENGPELIYHLGTHLDMADKLANMSPSQAIMELGRISGNMSAKTTVKESAAPDPIEPLNSGGAIAKDRGPKGAKFE